MPSTRITDLLLDVFVHSPPFGECEQEQQDYDERADQPQVDRVGHSWSRPGISIPCLDAVSIDSTSFVRRHSSSTASHGIFCS